MVGAVITHVLKECFVLKVEDKEYQVTQHDEPFESLVGKQKGARVQVEIKDGKIIKVQA